MKFDDWWKQMTDDLSTREMRGMCRHTGQQAWNAAMEEAAQMLDAVSEVSYAGHAPTLKELAAVIRRMK